MIPIPREKAAQLVVDNQLKVKSLNYEEAVQCAIITCDEVMSYAQKHGAIGLTDYYKEVKQELEKL